MYLLLNQCVAFQFKIANEINLSSRQISSHVYKPSNISIDSHVVPVAIVAVCRQPGSLTWILDLPRLGTSNN